jgi:hypothetical protein
MAKQSLGREQGKAVLTPVLAVLVVVPPEIFRLAHGNLASDSGRA